MTVPLVVLGVALAAWGWSVVFLRRCEREHAHRCPFDDSGAVRGAEAFTLTGSTDHAVLLVHGFNDTAQSMSYLGAQLHARGWTVRALLLPGHGVRLSRMASEARAAAWIAHMQQELDALQRTYGCVSVVGQSMGGALALLASIDRPTIRAVVLLAPYLEMPRRLRWQTVMAWCARPLLLYLPSSGGSASIHDPVARAASLGPGYVTAQTLSELRRIVDAVQRQLVRVQVPIRYLQSRTDHRVAPDSAERSFAALGSPAKEFHWVSGCGHILSADHCRDVVAAQTAEWLERFTG